jgi:hypothetical protein
MGMISFTMDMWTDFNLKPYMAVTAHWLEQSISGRQLQIALRADLIGFVHVPGSHAGRNLAEVFFFILKRLNIAKKVKYLI